MQVFNLGYLTMIGDMAQRHVGYLLPLDWFIDTRHNPAVLRAEYTEHGQAKRLNVFILTNALEIVLAAYVLDDGRDTWPETLRVRVNYPA